MRGFDDIVGRRPLTTQLWCMIDLGSIWLFAVPFALAAAIPGPALAALMGQLLARGPRASVRFEVAFLAIKWLGIVYLVFVAYKLWTAAPAVPLQGGAVPAAGHGSFPGGMAGSAGLVAVRR